MKTFEMKEIKTIMGSLEKLTGAFFTINQTIVLILSVSLDLVGNGG
jgi:hypothetical protein